MNLNLKRPIAFFDLETTGLDIVKDRIIEISILKISPDGKEETYTRRVNPTIPISKEASKITGIVDDDLKDMPTFKEVAKEVAKFIENCDLAGYNSNKFDVPLLAEELLRADVAVDFSKRKLIDVQVIYHKKEQRTLSAAYEFYCNKKLKNAHSAEADTFATYEILKGQVEMYDDLENDIDSLSKISYHNRNVDFAGRIVYNSKDEPVFNFGKYKGKIVTEVLEKDPGYFGWFLNADFPLYTKQVLSRIKLSMTQKVK
ncbi:MAG: ribonuclease H-like domain-containing protein [Bacteroidales bacterium]|nr:ribonuclease H-like domain-containing protein [Bacteroidales bacterium]